MAVIKNIPIHVSGAGRSGVTKAVGNVVNYIDDETKNLQYISSIDYSIERVLEYDVNADKTIMDDGKIKLVSYIDTDKDSIRRDFNRLRDLYYETHTMRNYRTDESGRGKREIVAFHFIQSFAESRDDMDPLKAHQIGVEWLRKIGYLGVVSTHLDTDNLHNHILVCAFPQRVNQKRLIMNRGAWREVCEISDNICREYQIPVLGPDKLYGQNISREKTETQYAEERARAAGKSYKEQLRRDIDTVIQKCKDWDGFVEHMRQSGWMIRESSTGKTVTAVEVGDEEHRCRIAGLGAEYSMEEIKRRIDSQRERGYEASRKKKNVSISREVDLKHGIETKNMEDYNSHSLVYRLLEMLINLLYKVRKKIEKLMEGNTAEKELYSMCVADLTTIDQHINRLRNLRIKMKQSAKGDGSKRAEEMVLENIQYGMRFLRVMRYSEMEEIRDDIDAAQDAISSLTVRISKDDSVHDALYNEHGH